MTDPEALKRQLREKSKESAARTDALLEGELQALRAATVANLQKLAPKLNDAYAQLIAAVEQSTKRNESVAEFRERLSKLGPAAAALGRAALTLLRG